VRELGLRGVNIEPGLRKRGSGATHVDHPDLYPIYETMSALDAPVMVYTSAFASKPPYLVNEAPPYDRVLGKFPKLKIVLGHGGYPCVRQILELAPRQANLFICQDIHTFWPGGYLYRKQIERLQDQFIFGTSYPFSSMAEPTEATLRFSLSRAAMEKYLWGNGARLLKVVQSAEAEQIPRVRLPDSA